ncbi:hypothetical protein VKT23_008159 [Stygiomarasmius scandens]|uniref:Uncharacterized protein n=1 Tax=Marasmiellus scandens TaxID=2682957 RepID=A0ABR1JIK2_9AGAR
MHKDAVHPPPPSPPAHRFPAPTPPPRTPSLLPPPSSPFSSRRSPRRRQNGSPVRLPWSAAPFTLPLPFRKKPDIEAHPVIDGTPCDTEGFDLPTDALPPLPPHRDANDYTPFENCGAFELAEFLYHDEQMSGAKVDRLNEVLAGWLGGQRDPPFANHQDMYATIDAIPQGDIPWESFTVKYNGNLTDDTSSVPTWKTREYEVWFRDPLSILKTMLGNPNFKDEFDIAPKRITRNGKRLYRDLMTGNWAWFQCDEIAKDENTHGAMFVPVLLGSDKTTVSVATGQNDYYPLYISLGNVHSSVRRAHRDAVALLGFLAVPKTSQENSSSADFRKFRRQLFHTSLEHILSSLRPHMSTPRVTQCPDGHLRRVIYGLGPYIADYPEQALLACIVQNWCPRCTSPPNDLDADTGRRSHHHTDTLSDGCTLKELWDDYGIVADLVPFTASFPRADIHELLAPDLLHQIIKGTFKDHLVDWVTEYIRISYPKKEADEILADIDRQVMTTSPYPGLRHFYEGREFKQWTGADSKGFMKVYLPAIVGHVPPQMVQAIADFMEFCYLVRRNVIDEDTLQEIDNSVTRFHQNREIFRAVGVWPDGFSLPRQHSMIHYRSLIQDFGAPNGLCSSITESKHIHAVKRPWRRSNKNKPLGQMLLTNQRLDKLAMYRADLESRGMLSGSMLDDHLEPAPTSNGETAGAADVEEGPVDDEYSQGEVKLAKKPARGVPRHLNELAAFIRQPSLPSLIRQYLYNSRHPDAPDGQRGSDIPLDECPFLDNNHSIYRYNSARAKFFAPSDLSGLGGMRQEVIHSTPSWYNGPPRYDCVFMEGDTNEAGFRGLLVAQVFMFFRFQYSGRRHSCALVHWYSTIGNAPCDQTGMWMVQPDFNQ